MNIFDKLYEIDVELSQDEIWIKALEEVYKEREVSDLDELIHNIPKEDEYIIRNLIDTGEDIISTKNEIIDEYWDGEEEEY